MPKQKTPGLARPVPITLDKERVIDFNLDACRRLGEILGINTLDGSLYAKQWDATTFQTVLWAGLVTDDPTLTLVDVGRIVPRHRMNDTFEAVLRAWGIDPAAVLKAAEEIEKDAGMPEAAAQSDPPSPTGMPSGLSAATTSG